MAAIIEINDNKLSDNWNEGVSVLYFYGTWCGPCKVFGPTFKNVSEKFDSVKFMKIDVDKNRELAEKYAIRSIPTIILTKDGKIIKTQYGSSSEDAFISWINNLLV